MIKTSNKIIYVQMRPDKAINLSFQKSVKLLKSIIGTQKFKEAFDITRKFPSPVHNVSDTEWLKQSKIIGINPRITKTYWGIVKYALTFPENAIHLFPLWEAGVGGGLYAPSCWKLSSEFLDTDLIRIGYDTPDKQLKLVINVLHSMGKTVAFDCLLHCDRFAEQVFLYPRFFEWAKLNNERTSQLFPPTIDYNKLYIEVEELIKHFLKDNGSADLSTEFNDKTFDLFFTEHITEQEKTNILFGKEKEQRLKRRIKLIELVRSKGFETLPVTEHTPSRPVIFDKMECDNTNNWATFKVKNKSNNAVIFGAITPYKLYPIDNQGYPITPDPNFELWDYLACTYKAFQKEFNFDFLRADMAHNQPAHSHNNSIKDLYNKKEIWAHIKDKIQENVLYFGSLAEAFLNIDYYIDGYQDMENKKFDIVLGPLNFLYLNEDYITSLKELDKLKNKFSYKTCIASMSNDIDKAENNDLFCSPLANEIRLFTGLFTNAPSYMGIGLETRDYSPTNSNMYSCGYTNYQFNDFCWGNNLELFNNISKLRELFSKIHPCIIEEEMLWLNTNNPSTLAWIFVDKNTKRPSYLFAINLDSDNDCTDIVLENIEILIDNENKYLLKPILSTVSSINKLKNEYINKISTKLAGFDLGEARAYEITYFP